LSCDELSNVVRKYSEGNCDNQAENGVESDDQKDVIHPHLALAANEFNRIGVRAGRQPSRKTCQKVSLFRDGEPLRGNIDH